MKTKIIYDPIPKTERDQDFDERVIKALLLSLKEKGLLTHRQYEECQRKRNG